MEEEEEGREQHGNEEEEEEEGRETCDEEEKEGKVRPLPLLLSAQTKDVSATIIQSQKRDEKQIQRGWQGTMKY